MLPQKNAETYLGCHAEYSDADIVLFGAPFDSTTTYRPGTRFASRTMRGDSWGLETYSPYQDRDLGDSRIMDAGDPELSYGNPRAALNQIRDYVTPILRDHKIPLMVGGEHLVTLGSFEAAAAQYPDICLLHFDAHTDLRDDYLGEALSHSTVIRRCHDIVGDGRIHQHGIRSGERDEFLWAREHTTLYKYDLSRLADSLRELKGRPVYFTLDLDVLDPSVFPGTGTPEPGGVDFRSLLDAVIRVTTELNIVACDITELSPIYDPSGASTAVACKILREILLGLQR